MLIISLSLGFIFEPSGLLAGTLTSPSNIDAAMTNLSRTIHFSAPFVFGALLAGRSRMLQTRTSGWHLFMLMVFAGFLALSPSDTAKGMSAILILLVVLGSAAIRSALLLSPVQWLGRVSYSLYLIHWPVTMAVYHYAGPARSLSVTFAGFLLSALGAEAMYRTVEAPSMRLGRWLTRQPRPGQTVTA